jgi:hypothetical protein
MALPNIEKTWEVDLNIPFGGEDREEDHADGLLLFVLAVTGQRSSIATNPWTVAGSSDASTAGFPGPGWQTRSDITFRRTTDSGSGRSWIVLERPISGDQLMIDCFTNTGDATMPGRCVAIDYSPTGGFSGGSTTSAPTATDQVQLNSGNSGVYWLGGYDGGGHYYLHIRHSNDGRQTYAFWTYRGYAVNYWLFADLEDAPTGWTIPVVAAMSIDSSTSDEVSFANLYTAQTVRGRVVGGGGAISASLITASWDGDLVAVNLNAANDFDGTYPITAVGVGSTSVGANGMLGRLPDIWFGTQTQSTSTSYPTDESRQFAAMGDIVVPWDGSPVVAG